jgi:hypothetical protein
VCYIMGADACATGSREVRGRKPIAPAQNSVLEGGRLVSTAPFTAVALFSGMGRNGDMAGGRPPAYSPDGAAVKED